jgi:predicted nucleotidyltransferase
MAGDSGGLTAAREVADALARGLGERLVGVVLFGSVARGEGSPTSDLDVLVVAEGLPGRFLERLRDLRALVPARLRGRTSLVIRTPDEFAEAFPSLYLDIALDGIILHDRGGYMQGRLERIRALVGDAGLSRVRTPTGFFWRWRVQPAGSWRIDWNGVVGL